MIGPTSANSKDISGKQNQENSLGGWYIVSVSAVISGGIYCQTSPGTDQRVAGNVETEIKTEHFITE